MSNLVLIAQAVKEIPYAAEHVTWLLREKKVKGEKVGGTWIVDLDDLKEYHRKMEELGSKRHSPRGR